MNSHKVHVNIEVYGRVQGVGFRYSALQMARQYNIKGFVKNRVDGSVFIEAEGSHHQINEFISWCYEGSSFSRVTDVVVTNGTLKNYDFFDIAH